MLYAVPFALIALAALFYREVPEDPRYEKDGDALLVAAFIFGILLILKDALSCSL